MQLNKMLQNKSKTVLPRPGHGVAVAEMYHDGMAVAEMCLDGVAVAEMYHSCHLLGVESLLVVTSA